MLGKICFFKKIFILANNSIDVVLEMFSFSFFDMNIWFVDREIIWRKYTAIKALPTTKRVKLINENEFAAAELNVDSETFIIDLAVLDIRDTNMAVHSS